MIGFTFDSSDFTKSTNAIKKNIEDKHKEIMGAMADALHIDVQEVLPLAPFREGHLRQKVDYIYMRELMALFYVHLVGYAGYWHENEPKGGFREPGAGIKYLSEKLLRRYDLYFKIAARMVRGYING